MDSKTYAIVDSVEKLQMAIARTRKAQQLFAAYTQEQVDRISLAKLAVEETGIKTVAERRENIISSLNG